MKILVIGSGGREHAIAWRLALEGHQILCAPGNPGTAQVATNIATADYLAIESELTVVGPEGPLVAGVVDQFLNEITPFDVKNPSAENIAEYFHTEITTGLGATPVPIRITEVRVWETDIQSASYRP